MVLKTSKIKCHRGVSLVSTMVAVAILLIALIGTSTFRYAAALDERRADAHTTAARIALTLCEGWRGVRGALTYDPTVLLDSDMQVTAGEGPVKPVDFTLLGSYIVIFSDDAGVNDYRATLSWKDIQPGLRALNVTIAWASRENAVVSVSMTSGTTTDKSFALTVYTQTL
jgi:Tfp pilus assembly protein PilV